MDNELCVKGLFQYRKSYQEGGPWVGFEEWMAFR